MKQEVSPKVLSSVQALLQALDKDIAHIQTSIATLDQMRAFLIKRDEAGLTALLAEVRHLNFNYFDHDTYRQQLRQTLAQELGCAAEAVTLSQLEGTLPVSWRQPLREKKNLMQTMVHQLQRQWQITGALLNDCARLNRALFQAIFQPPAGRTLTYGPGATQQPTMPGNLMNMHI
ncbi:flagellar export chaperone FlgN [Planctomycetota bacterium]